ncbi:hypothetical protein [Peptostreptococcus sp. D1]|uniref:hypothetical protein n=1 Tax=Peptostreptococcus sp. D1 TaxID=72304 RepID=UPI0008ED59E6|nr:hypothetical protein [Peptostreptococcus sp. D1]SFE87467.1 hypothetical protein SAMN02910278_01928 [Peptostreptococcus sp. D1]
MTEQDFLWYLIKVGVPIVALVTPLLKLNGSIIRLNERLETVLNHNKNQDLRLNKHSEQIDDLTAKSENHNARIKNLEQRECKFELSNKRGE